MAKCVNCKQTAMKGGKCADCYVPTNARGPMKEARVHNGVAKSKALTLRKGTDRATGVHNTRKMLD